MILVIICSCLFYTNGVLNIYIACFFISKFIIYEMKAPTASVTNKESFSKVGISYARNRDNNGDT